jgi:hypothetical protein
MKVHTSYMHFRTWYSAPPVLGRGSRVFGDGDPKNRGHKNLCVTVHTIQIVLKKIHYIGDPKFVFLDGKMNAI